MALGTTKISATTGAGIAAATAGRLVSGGRNVASSSRAEIESLNLGAQIGVNDESLLRFHEDPQLNPDGKRRRDSRDGSFTPLTSRGAPSLRFETPDEADDAGDFRLFLTDVLRGVGTYEANMRITAPGTVKPGAVMNYLL
jgi:hypothetical protein